MVAKKKVAKKKTPKKIGRPTDYTDRLADKICEKVALGQSMRTICALETMPAMTTMFRWLREKDEFRQQYETAKQECAELMVEDMLDIADNEAQEPLLVDGVPVIVDEKPVMVTSQVKIQHSRLKVDTRKFIAAKLKPKKYGERIQHANDPDNPMPSAIVTKYE